MPWLRSRAFTSVLPAFVVAVQIGAAQSDRAALAGRVVDPDGWPVRDAVVTLSGPGLWQVAVGADGEFSFNALPDGTYQLTAKHAGYLDGRFGRRRPEGPGAPLVLAVGQHVDNADLRLWQYASISGTVFDESGDPLVGAEVRALRAVWTNGHAGFEAVTGAHTNDYGVSNRRTCARHL